MITENQIRSVELSICTDKKQDIKSLSQVDRIILRQEAIKKIIEEKTNEPTKLG